MSDLINVIKRQLNRAINTTDIKGLKKYQGKVRDVYDLGDKLLIVTTDRISAFDRVLAAVPYKGAILNETTLFWFQKTEDIIKNHIIKKIHPNVLLVKKVKILPIEIIVRGFLTGGGWREYSKTGMISGIKIPSGLKKDVKFDKPIITPTTKAEVGHDESITVEEIINKGLVSEQVMRKVEATAMKLFERGQDIASKNGLFLVDTKYEFGLDENGNLILADEIHTSDSSRYWYKDSYSKLFEAGETQRALDKEYFREWLMSKGFNGDGNPPLIPDEIISGICERYIEGFEMITGNRYKLEDVDFNLSLKNSISEYSV